MILEIEYWKGDTILLGKADSVYDLKNALMKTEELYDRGTDNFVELFCRMFGWEKVDTDETPDYVYDRDTTYLYRPHDSEDDIDEKPEPGSESFYPDVECPVFKKTIDYGMCYDMSMIAERCIKPGALKELSEVEDIDAAREICKNCKNNPLT